MKKWLFLPLISVMVLLSACGSGSAIKELESQLEEFTEENLRLKEDISTAKEQVESLILDVEKASEFEQKLKDAEKTFAEEKKEFETIITNLEDEKTKLVEKESTLTTTISELEKKNKSLESNAQAKNQSTTNASTETKTVSNNNATTEKQTVKHEEPVQISEPESPEPTQDCNIKGSSSGIYHVPGSTYYAKTTNPAAMFCSVEEAQNAGYRAPKR